MKKTSLILLALMLVGILAAQPWHCQSPIHNEQHHKRMDRNDKPNMMMRIMQELELSDSQLDKLKEQRVAMEKEKISIRAEIKKLRIDEKVARQEFDFDKLNKLNDSICDLEKELKSKHIDNMEKCWNILTEDQKKQAQELINDFPKMRRNCQNDDNDMENQKQFRKRRFNN